jgi:hypothetical protein
MTRTLSLLALSAPVFLAACQGDPVGPTSNPQQTQWEKTRPASFRYTYTAFTPDSGMVQYMVLATPDSVFEAWRMANGGWEKVAAPQALSIDSLIAKVAGLENLGPRAAVTVEYHETFGFPSDVFVQGDTLDPAHISTYRIKGFLEAPLVPRPVTTVPPSPWPQKKPAGIFAYRYAIDCFCFAEYTGPFSVVATRDSVLSVWRLSAGGDSTRILEATQSYSIDSILVHFHAAVARNPDFASVTYDSTYGFPARTSIDRYFGWADDETGSHITQFKILSP